MILEKIITEAKMLDRIEREELIRLAAQRTGQEEEMVDMVVDAFLGEIYQVLKRGQSVTLKGFGCFYVRPERESWVFKFNPSQKWRALFGWSSTYKGEI
jgi:DNA-binding protein HU-beta